MFLAFVRGPSKPIVDERDLLGDDHAGIRCPACRWRPRKSDLWACNPGCGHVWHTFDTRGVCPNCQKRWAVTHCFKCGEWSDHDAWYEQERAR